MTDPTRPTDEELAQRIRRSMSHYHFDRPLQVAPRRSWGMWDAARLVAAGAAGAALTLVVLGLLRGISPAPVGEASQTPRPSPSIAGPSAPPSATPAQGPTEDEAAAGCLRLNPDDVAEDWLEEGEDAATVIDRIAGLPLVLRDDRETGSVLVFADDRFVVMCEWSAGASEPEGIARVVRESTDDWVKLLFAFSEQDGAESPTPDYVGDQVSVGIARDDVARVLVILADGARVDALVGEGLWLARWQEPIEAVTLRAYDASGTLLDEVPADPTSPDLALIGPTWTVTTIVNGDQAQPVGGGAATIRVADDETFSFDTGCNVGGGQVTILDGALQFSDVSMTLIGCEGAAAELEHAVTAILGPNIVSYAIDGDTLRLTAGDRGLVLVGD
jgi:heat shock protein HslJ